MDDGLLDLQHDEAMPRVRSERTLVVRLNHAGFMLYSGMSTLIGFLFKLGLVRWDASPAAREGPPGPSGLAWYLGSRGAPREDLARSAPFAAAARY